MAREGGKQECPKGDHRGCCCESPVPTPLDLLQVTSLTSAAPRWRAPLESVALQWEVWSRRSREGLQP